MDGEIRSTPGDRLVSRILTRVRRRPRLGLSPDFYARFGMDDPWNAPEIGGEAATEGDGFVYLSAQPYYAMMRRLAAARKRREKRLAAFAERRAGTKLRAVTRSWPGETAASLAVSRLARIALDDMTLPPVIQPAPAPAPVEQTAAPSAARSGPRSGTTRTNRGASAWWSTPFVPARVFGGAVSSESATDERASAHAPERPSRAGSAAHAGARLARAATQSGAAAREIEAALPAAVVGAKRHAIARIAEVIEALPPEQQRAEIVRVVRRLGASGPAVRTVYEDAPASRPAQVAARRADPTATAGLRPVLSRSPSMALASAPEVDRAASGTLATAERSENARGLTNLPRRSSASRALARGAEPSSGGSVPRPMSHARATTAAALSASPVATARVAPAPASRAAAASAPLARRPARALRASARAVARAGAAPLVDLVPTLSAAPAQAVRTATGAWVPARLAAPAERPVASRLREAGTAHAAARVGAGQVEGRSVLPRAMPASPDRLLATLPVAPAESTVAALTASPAALSASPVARSRAVARVAASSPVRTDAGAYVPARTLAPTTTGPVAGTARIGARAFRTPDGAAPADAPRSAAPTARTLSPSSFRTAEPLSAAPATGGGPTERHVAARASIPAARVAPERVAAQPGRPSGVLHAAARAGAPVAVAPSAALSRAAPARPPSMAHATARADLPAESSGLQPTVAPPRSERPARTAARVDARVAVPAAVAAEAAGAPSASVPTRAPTRSARVPRTASVRAAARATAPTAAAARLADAPAPAAAPRFARSGPLSWALPTPAALPAADGGAPTAHGTATPVPTPGRAAARRERPARAWTAAAVPSASVVSAPGGVFMSASAAARMPGVRLLRTEAGRLVAVVAPPADGAAPAPRATRAPANARSAATAGVSYAQPFVAPVDEVTDALGAPPAPARRRATEYAADRTRVAEASAYRGAYRAPEVTLAGAPEAAEAPSRTPARRERPRRVSATAGEMALPTPMATAPVGADTQGTATFASAAASAPNARTARRQPLEERLHGVAVGQPGAAAPTWAARSDGAPLVRSPGGLFESLAKASTTEEIIRVIYARAEGVRETPLAHEAPVVQVIEQIKQEVRREQAATVEATRASRLDAPSATVIRGQYVQPVKSTTRVRGGSVRGLAATTRSTAAGSGDARITALVKKLQGLIHLAEMEGRLADARSQVRLAEDSAGARAEGQGPVGASKETGEKREKQDIEALGREVLEVVSREMELRRMRRLEDHDESVWW